MPAPCAIGLPLLAAWFDRHLRDMDADTGPALTLLDLGAWVWRGLREWPDLLPGAMAPHVSLPGVA